MITPFSTDPFSMVCDLFQDFSQSRPSYGSEVYIDGGDEVIEVEAAGAKADNLEVTVHESILNASWIRKTRAGAQKVFRSFRLHKTADVDNIKASLQDGLLTIRVPKKPEAKARKIPLISS